MLKNCIAFCALTLSSLAMAENYVPKSDDEVLIELPDYVQALPPISADPKSLQDLHAVEEAIHVMLRLARTSGDPRLYGQAQALMGEWWNDRDLKGRLLLYRANIKQFNHEFQPALVDLRAFLKNEPHDLEGLLQLMSIELVVGDFSAADQACLSIATQSALVSNICHASVLGLRGEGQRAIAELQPLEPFLNFRGRKLLPYFFGTLGDVHARMGHLDEAEKYYEKVLAIDKEERFFIAALADVQFDLGKYQAIVDRLSRETIVDSLLVRFAAAQKRLLAPGLSESQAELMRRFAREADRNTLRHEREACMFQLYVVGDASRALELARSNWLVQREPIDVRIYLDAALAQKAIQDLKKIYDWTKSSGYRDDYVTKKLAGAGF